MKKFEVGQKVRFINGERHQKEPEYYPQVGTVGEIKKNDDYDGTIFVQWPEGTTSNSDMVVRRKGRGGGGGMIASGSMVYEDNLSDILAFTGGKRLLTIADVVRYLGISRDTVKARFNITGKGITAATLARKLAYM